jgi:dolichol-phosphate mannosyltransferase
MSSEKKTLDILCPVFNEEGMVEIFYQALKKVLQSLESRYEWNIIFIMDRSSDNTSQILTQLSQNESRVKAIKLSSRFGHQMSLVAGIDHSHAEAIIMMDSDLQHPPELIPKLLEEYEKGNDVVYTIRKEPMDKSAVKRMGSKKFYQLMNKLSEVKLNSGEADFRLISRKVALVFQNDIREKNQFLRGLFRWVGFNSVGVEYSPAERTVGESKYNMSRMMRFASAGIVSFSKKPLQYAIYLGIIFSCLGLLSAAISFFSYFITDETPSGWTTLSILISVFGGMQMFFLGVLGEYLGAIFDEVKDRPLYIIEEKLNFE